MAGGQVATAPGITLTFNPAGPRFLISADAKMPVIQAKASLVNVPALPLGGVQYHWTVGLVMQPAKVPLAMGRTVTHPAISATTPTGDFTIPFTKVRGGDLTVKVSVSIGSSILKAESRGLLVLGPTLPIPAPMLIAAGASDIMMKIMAHESQYRQFEDSGPHAGYPLFSRDHKGGVGLTQITKPKPKDDEIWNWKENLAGGMTIFKEKYKTARHHLENYANSKKFKRYVREYNEARALKATIPRPGAPPRPPVPPPDLQITLAAPTEEQIRREAIRAFNGYGPGSPDPDAPPRKPHHRVQLEYLYEYNALLDRTDWKKPVLVVNEQLNSTVATASWHENTAADRLKWWKDHGLLKHGIQGDPDYVAKVLKIKIADP